MMADTNEVKVIKEEQTIVEGETPEVKPVDGFSHLTEEDLNPDYEPPKEAEPDKVDESVKTESSDDSENAEVNTKEEEVSSEEWNINGTTYNEEDMKTRMVKDYKNLSSFTGKQAEEIGKLKQRVTDLTTANSTTTPDESVADTGKDTNKEYDIYTPEGVKELATDVAKNIVDEQAKQQDEKRQDGEFKSAADVARKKFSENHPEYASEDDVVELVKKGNARGIALGAVPDSNSMLNYLETVHAQETNDFSYFSGDADKEQAETQTKTTVEKITEGQKVPTNLSKVNSSELEIDYDNLTDAQWAKLPDEKRQELLGLN